MSQSKSRKCPKAGGATAAVAAAKPVPVPEVIHPHAAAIDVHSDNHVVCVGPNQVQTFGAYTVDLHATGAAHTDAA